MNYGNISPLESLTDKEFVLLIIVMPMLFVETIRHAVVNRTRNLKGILKGRDFDIIRVITNIYTLNLYLIIILCYLISKFISLNFCSPPLYYFYFVMNVRSYCNCL